MISSFRNLLPVPLLIPALLVGGCSPDGAAKPETSPGKPAASAPPQDAAPLPAVELPDSPGALVDTISGRVKEAGSVHAEIASQGEGGESGSADLRTDTESPALRMTVTGPPTTHAVVLDGVVYARAEGEEIEPGKPWARLAHDEIPAEPAEVKQMLTALLGGIESALREISVDTGLALVREGEFKGDPAAENLDGTSVRRYEGETDPAKVTEEKFKGSGTVGWTLWVGTDGLPRRFSAVMKGAGLTVDYSRWGVPVTVEAPPANQVASLS
ncbi:hypothetical protein [Actinocorallia libanotica]|uniref:Lipoprotein LprG n=1 Tax=Actinocorallia libanotica TaxID=46162 RepID=A0ABN1RUT1_9ACTN